MPRDFDVRPSPTLCANRHVQDGEGEAASSRLGPKFRDRRRRLVRQSLQSTSVCRFFPTFAQTDVDAETVMPEILTPDHHLRCAPIVTSKA